MAKYRHEWKYEINYGDFLVLRQRMSAVAGRDRHAPGGTYRVRSLYFDNMGDKVLREKLDGVNRREKFRIRYYNDDTSWMRLEKKSKVNGLCLKESQRITKEQVQMILDGTWEWMPQSSLPLIKELYVKLREQGLRPKIIVDYLREPFVFGTGGVRVTLDYQVRLGMEPGDFLNPFQITVPAGAPIILEVKWNEFLPDIIRDALQIPGRRTGAFSKYAACRIYG